MHAFNRNKAIFFSLCFIFCIYFPHAAFAETILDSDTILVSDTTWTKTGSPYIVQDELMIGDGVTLHIEPGVIVALSGTNPEIDLDGTIDAQGTADEPITFEPVSDLLADHPDFADDGFQSNPWSLIAFGGSLNMKYVNVKDSPQRRLNLIEFLQGGSVTLDSAHITGMGFDLIHASFAATSTTMSLISGQTAINTISSPLVSLADVLISSIDAYTAVDLQSSRAVISSTTISDISGDGIDVDEDILTRIPSNVSIVSSVIKDVGQDGILFYSSDMTIASSTISGAGLNGIENFGINPISIASSTIKDISNAGIAAFGGGSRTATSSLYITASKIADASYGIEADGKEPIIISNSAIASTSIYAVSNVGNDSVIAQNDFWGDASGPYEETLNPGGLGGEIGDFVSGNVVFSPWLSFDPTVGPTPVIIVPGILGSAEKHGVWLIDPIFHVYDNLIATLEANGYIASTTLFTFPYDWRNSNADTAKLLKAKIDEVKEICECDKVDIVAHSMGGLVARAYAESPDYDDDIDQLVFLGTPQRGAPEDYPMWEGGEEPGGFDIGSLVLNRYFKNETEENGYKTAFDYVHDFPITSVQELLPIYNYLTIASTSEMIQYPNGYPQNTFLENMDQGLNSLLSSDIHITNIVGNTGTSTITGINVVNDPTKAPEWTDGYPKDFDSFFGDHGLIDGLGDGTVPLSSAELGNNLDVELPSSHMYLPTDGEKEVYEKIHGGEPSILVNKSLPVGAILISVLSPVDMVVTAPDGSKIGKDFSTGEEINQIPGAFYSGFDTDDEFVVIPNPINGQYQVQTEGTGRGSYTIVASQLDDDQALTESVFTDTTSVGTQSAVSFSVSSTSVSDITQEELDQPQTQPQKVILNPRDSGGMHSVLPVSTIPASTTITTFSPDSFMITLNAPVEAFVNAYKLALASEAKPAVSKNFAKTNSANTKTNTEVASVHEAVGQIGGAGIMNWIGSKIIGTINKTKNIISNLFKK